MVINKHILYYLKNIGEGEISFQEIYDIRGLGDKKEKELSVKRFEEWCNSNDIYFLKNPVEKKYYLKYKNK